MKRELRMNLIQNQAEKRGGKEERLPTAHPIATMTHLRVAAATTIEEVIEALIMAEVVPLTIARA